MAQLAEGQTNVIHIFPIAKPQSLLPLLFEILVMERRSDTDSVSGTTVAEDGNGTWLTGGRRKVSISGTAHIDVTKLA